MKRETGMKSSQRERKRRKRDSEREGETEKKRSRAKASAERESEKESVREKLSFFKKYGFNGIKLIAPENLNQPTY